MGDRLDHWRRAEADWVLGRTGVLPLQRIAVDLIASREPSPWLATLATLHGDDDPATNREVVHRAMQELGLHPLDDIEAARTAIAATVEGIAGSSTTPEVGARDIWSLSHNLPWELRHMDLIALALDLDDVPDAYDDILREIREVASRMVGGGRSESPYQPSDDSSTK
jgi:hypothetical protein